MIESPLIQEMIAKTAAERLHKDILKVLNARCCPPPSEVIAAVRTIHEEKKLDELMDVALSCADLQAFRARLGR